MDRYSKITNKIKREIVLLKGAPCRWGRCTFCDYIDDNSNDTDSNHNLNKSVLNNVTGEFGVLEVINSGNVFELPKATLDLIKLIIKEKDIKKLFVESHWIYHKKIEEIRSFFGIDVVVKTGLESFNKNFREGLLNKGFNYLSIEELKTYFDSVCLLVGVKGQTKEIIETDIKTAIEYFDHFTVNVYIENSTPIKPDHELIKWFNNNYQWLNDLEKCDVLWVNTDFGVGD